MRYVQAGILAAQDRDYKTAFSYFFEAFEAFSAQDAARHSHKSVSETCAAGEAGADVSPGDRWHAVVCGTDTYQQSKTLTVRSKNVHLECALRPVFSGPPSRALQALKYMLLSKILQGKDDEVNALLTGKQGLRYYSVDSASTAPQKPLEEVAEQEGRAAAAAAAVEKPSAGVAVETAAAATATPQRDLEAMRQLAVCHKERSLKKFEAILETFGRELKGDEVLMHHIDELYENLLEKNLMKLLMPFCRVELAHVAKLIGLPLPKVEQKLSEMVLDGKLHGTLDQGVGVLLLYERQELPEMHVNALATIKNMAQVVDTLYEKSLQVL
ncbi:UNVERIFIED_CONTAM: hypothetical protein H355_008326 [Colinus virginianus]|nr:hypothetical protein H355_008326 [Colinus virginianus]